MTEQKLTLKEQTEIAFKEIGLPKEALPKHIAIIMDGNGRWAKRQGKARTMGHAKGAETVRKIVTACAQLEISVLTLYSFSIENWNRPEEEINFLMDLYVEYLASERQTMIDNNVKFVQIGHRKGLSPRLLEELDKTIEITKNHTGLTLALALNYGSRTEITDAVQAIAEKVKSGEINPQDISQETIAEHLYTNVLPTPDPDLLIRTAGELRVSNYLLWQISYAEIVVNNDCWPDYTREHLFDDLKIYAKRTRKFGFVVDES